MTRKTYPHGLHPGMPLEHYFSDPAEGDFGSLNSGNIPVLRGQSPLHFATRSPVLIERYDLEAAEDMANAVMHRGRVVHRMALGKGADYVVLEHDNFRTKEAQTLKAEAEKAGQSVILAKDLAAAQKQSAKLRTHLDELFMGETWFPEIAVLWSEDTPFGTVQCRALVDAWCPTLMHGVDLKSTTNASEAAAKRRLEQGGYDIQAAFYSRGLSAVVVDAQPGQVQFSTLFSETAAPYGSQSFQLSDMWLTSAWDECQLALRTFAKCQAADEWPGYPRTSRLVQPPAWLVTKRMEAELGIDDLDDQLPQPEPEEETTDA